MADTTSFGVVSVHIYGWAWSIVSNLHCKVILGPYHRGRETRFHVFLCIVTYEFGNLIVCIVLRMRSSTYQMLRFATVGVIATAIHYVVYLLLLLLLSETVAYSIGYAVSMVCNFVLTCLFTFRKKASTKRGLGFALAHLVNYCLQVSLLNLFLWMGISNSLAPIPVYCIAVPINYILIRNVFQRL